MLTHDLTWGELKQFISKMDKKELQDKVVVEVCGIPSKCQNLLPAGIDVISTTFLDKKVGLRSEFTPAIMVRLEPEIELCLLENL